MRKQVSNIKKTNLGNAVSWEGVMEDDVSFYARYKDSGLTVELDDEVIFDGPVESQKGNPNDISTDQMLASIGFWR